VGEKKMKDSSSFLKDSRKFRAVSAEERKVFLRSFIDYCVFSERKARFFGFIENDKGINKILSALDHFSNYLDLTRAINISNYNKIDSILLKFGIDRNSYVFVFSNLCGLRHGIVVKIEDVLDSVFKIGNGVIICSIGLKPSFFMYLGEEMCEQYLWHLCSVNIESINKSEQNVDYNNRGGNY
jgi:hypothetical protein